MPPLSKVERLILANQYRILGRLERTQAKAHAQRRRALERGYPPEMDEAVREIADAVPAETCSFVHDVLLMYSDIRSGAPLKKFPGFDANGEGDAYDYASFLLKEKKAYRSLGLRDVPNSHAPTFDRYQRMVKAWKAGRGAGPGALRMTKEQAAAILAHWGE